MSQSAIRAALYTAVGTVSNVGKVYDYKRRADEWDTFLEFYRTTINGVSQIRGWDITYRGFTARRDPQFARQVIHDHTFWVMGYMGLSDVSGTDKTFADLCEAVAAAIDANATLHTGVYNLTGPASIPELEVIPLGDVLCHIAQIIVVVPEQVS